MRLILKLTGVVLFVGLLHACNKQEFEGPSLTNYFGTFEVVEPFAISNDSPDFTSGERVHFQSKFNKVVDWKITITGETTASKKELTGTSIEIDPNSVFWTGTTDEAPFFQEEECSIELTFPNEADTLVAGLSIQSTKQFEGITIADFEDGLPEGTLMFKQLGGNMTFEIANDNPVQGDAYYKMGGRVGFDWVVGQIDIPLDISDVASSPEDFFLNLGILSGDANGEFATNQFVKIMISESDAPFNDNTSNNASDVFENDMEVYQYKFQPVDWAGWKYVNVSYDMFEEKNVTNQDVMYDRNPNNITAIRIQSQCCPWNSSTACPENETFDTRTDIDFVMFTEGVPLLDQ
jgi:hypothetical protein